MFVFGSCLKVYLCALCTEEVVSTVRCSKLFTDHFDDRYEQLICALVDHG
jgi:hypothetical protein